MKTLLHLLSWLLLGCTAVFAQPTPVESEHEKELQNFLATLHYQQGEIVIGDKLATLKVPESFRFLGSEDAQKVLVDLWGNPPGEKPLGMLLPAQFSPAAAGTWGVIITYEESGFVKDDDAAKIDYTKLLKEMRESTAESSKERVKEGFEAISLIGWAAPPLYDAAAKKLYWAKELQFGNSGEHTLNYDIRVLGRKGVLSLNCVAGVPQLQEIQSAAPEILSMIGFNAGNRYADFKPGSDKVAAYGIATLVAGGIAAKAGLFKVVLVALLAAKKFVIIGVIALFSICKKIFQKTKKFTEV